MARAEFTLKTKLGALARHSRCPGVPEKGRTCGRKFGSLSEIRFDHIGREEQTHDNSVDNCRPLCQDCHDFKTFGTGATTAGSDIHMAAKTKRLVKKQAAFRSRLAAKQSPSDDANGEQSPSERKRQKSNIPSRRFRKKSDGAKSWSTT